MGYGPHHIRDFRSGQLVIQGLKSFNYISGIRNRTLAPEGERYLTVCCGCWSWRCCPLFLPWNSFLNDSELCIGPDPEGKKDRSQAGTSGTQQIQNCLMKGLLPFNLALKGRDYGHITFRRI